MKKSWKLIDFSLEHFFTNCSFCTFPLVPLYGHKYVIERKFYSCKRELHELVCKGIPEILAFYFRKKQFSFHFHPERFNFFFSSAAASHTWHRKMCPEMPSNIQPNQPTWRSPRNVSACVCGLHYLLLLSTNILPIRRQKPEQPKPLSSRKNIILNQLEFFFLFGKVFVCGKSLRCFLCVVSQITDKSAHGWLFTEGVGLSIKDFGMSVGEKFLLDVIELYQFFQLTMLCRSFTRPSQIRAFISWL